MLNLAPHLTTINVELLIFLRLTYTQSRGTTLAAQTVSLSIQWQIGWIEVLRKAGGGGGGWSHTTKSQEMNVCCWFFCAWVT